jgi:glycerophosphoryl diester phosphodiesterase
MVEMIQRTSMVILCLSLFLFAKSCAPQESIVDVTPNYDSLLSGVRQLSAGQRSVEGLFSITDTRNLFGQHCVLIARSGLLCIYCENRGTYFILNGGIRQKDSALVYAGTWRVPTSLTTGQTYLEITNKALVKAILLGSIIPPNTTIEVRFGVDNKELNQTMNLTYKRPLERSLDSFAIIAHRAGGRNSDYLPAPENSLSLAKLSPALGANAVEIDIYLTKDSVPIIYHDEDFNWRLIRTGTLLGPVGDYTFSQVRTLGKLHNGEDIPTLREMLDTLLNSTDINYVWLDIKSPDVLDKALPLLREFNLKARQINRKFLVLAGLPTEEVYNAFITKPNFELYPTICELDIDKVRQAKAEVYAPRWTLGTQNDIVNTMNNEGRKVFVWTLDDVRYIRSYLKDGEFNGILTNYPSVVAYEYLSMEKK